MSDRYDITAEVELRSAADRISRYTQTKAENSEHGKAKEATVKVSVKVSPVEGKMTL